MSDHNSRAGSSYPRGYRFLGVSAGLLLFLLAAVPVFSFRPGPGSNPIRPASSSVRSDRANPSEYVWHTFTTQDGLPSNKIFSVEALSDQIWIGTDSGLVRLENGRFRTYTPEDGLAHRAVLSLDVNPRTGALWIGTMGGLNWFSAGRFKTYDQLNSGLANNVVYRVETRDRYVWVATAAGANRLDTHTGRWKIFNDTNTPMHERWVYGLAAGDSLVYLATWGGGVMEYDTYRQQWEDYVDPDGEMEIDAFPDDGLVHDVVATVSYHDGVLWAGTYFGLSRYDGSNWNTYFSESSGLASNFINFVKAGDSGVWICTDKGLNHFDGRTWHTYRRQKNGRGEVIVSGPNRSPSRTETPTAIGHNYVWKMDTQGDTLWVATEKGLSRGVPAKTSSTAATR